ncbi:hypothetical protein Bhyg_09130 [Pseudolycoriella hygida]|uniref:Uncharacterized protein n=1 Tax=Pseudolycoriella hygida TaxID=35572 RepID=A0A9Q0N5Y9_9DIPT|nr:hypothetical protein Bhyg_09130 [Pseudolycoriella hygida]
MSEANKELLDFIKQQGEALEFLVSQLNKNSEANYSASITETFSYRSTKPYRLLKAATLGDQSSVSLIDYPWVMSSKTTLEELERAINHSELEVGLSGRRRSE